MVRNTRIDEGVTFDRSVYLLRSLVGPEHTTEQLLCLPTHLRDDHGKGKEAERICSDYDAYYDDYKGWAAALDQVHMQAHREELGPNERDAERHLTRAGARVAAGHQDRPKKHS